MVISEIAQAALIVDGYFWNSGHEQSIFETPHNEMKCVMSVKESNFNEKKDQNVHICSRSGPRWLTPPPDGQPDSKTFVFIYAFPKSHHFKTAILTENEYFDNDNGQTLLLDRINR